MNTEPSQVLAPTGVAGVGRGQLSPQQALCAVTQCLGTGWAAVLGPRGQEMAGGAAHEAGTLPPVTAKAGRPLRLQLTDAHFTGVCPRLEALPWFILSTLVLTVSAARAAASLLCDLLCAGQGWAPQPHAAYLASLTATPLTAAWRPLKLLPVLVLPALGDAAVANRAEAGSWRGVGAEDWRTWLLLAVHETWQVQREQVGSSGSGRVSPGAAATP